MLTHLRKSLFYVRLRQYFPMKDLEITDDQYRIDDAQVVMMDWPAHIAKPKVGLVQDYGLYPSWTKYARFFQKNAIPYEIYPIHNWDWLDRAYDFDLIVGMPSNALYDIEEIQTKYSLIETCLGIMCYPSAAHAMLYENKQLEAFICQTYRVPFAKTYISHDAEDALRLIETLPYPVVSKVVPSSSSIGVELVRSKKDALRIVKQAFSHNGRKTHLIYRRQKEYVYFQEFIPNDGYDIRVIVVGNHVFGYFRKAPAGDFRASGMHHEEKRSLPLEAMTIARGANKIIKSPQLVVDMLHGQDGKYYINELSPLCQMSTLDQLQVDGVPGAYVFDDDDTCHFEAGSYWVHTLALNEFLLNHYLPCATHKTM